MTKSWIFIRRFRSFAALAACCLVFSTARAHFVEGNVYCTEDKACPANGTTPLAKVLVTAKGEQGNVETALTNVNGFFHIELPTITQNYELSITLPGAGEFICPPTGSTKFLLDTTVDEGHVMFQVFFVAGDVCGEQPPPPCPDCVDGSLGLGSAAGCTVLQLGPGKVSITGPAGGILGDICVGPGGKLSMSGDEFVTGTIRLSPGVPFSNSSHGTVTVEQNADLSGEIADALAAASAAAALAPTQTFDKLDGKSVTTITGAVGLNVISVGDISLSGKQITLTGPAGAKFIFNVTGKFVLTGGGAGPQIRVDGVNVHTKDVLYNIIGEGADVAFSGGGGGVNCCAAIVDGTLLAPNRKINLSPGLVNGEVISGKDISIVSGSSVRCPCPPK